MTTLTDRPLWPSCGARAEADIARLGRPRFWSHVVSDMSYAELQAFAARLGVPPRAFDRDHDDVPSESYGTVVIQGATPVGAQRPACLTAAGLRRRKRRGGT